jgi:cysteinyl-tRNA synthetase, unknown class
MKQIFKLLDGRHRDWPLKKKKKPIEFWIVAGSSAVILLFLLVWMVMPGTPVAEDSEWTIPNESDEPEQKLADPGPILEPDVKEAPLRTYFNPDWHYQLQNAKFDELLLSPATFLIIDPDDTELNTAQRNELADSGKKVIAYLSIGEAEDYRSYWESNWKEGIPTFIEEENKDWEGNFRVQYWRERWQDIIFNTVDKLMYQGWDGVYLDRVDVYQHFEDEGRDEAREEMIHFVTNISKRVHGIDKTSYVFGQNAEELYEVRLYRKNVDGIGVEDLFFDDNSEVNAKDREYRLQFLKDVIDDGKIILNVDYPTDSDKICEFYENCRDELFQCAVSNRDLDQSVLTNCSRRE